MKALVWHGKGDVRCDTVPDPTIENPGDMIVRITSTAICGSDLHLYDGYMPFMEEGDILGHEPMGEVMEVGSEVKNLKAGDRVVVPFTIACGTCFFCQKELYSCCDTTNRDAEKAAKLMGHAPAGLFGYSHITGHYPGGQAEYLRVPHADVGPIKIESSLPDEKVVFLSDIFPTGYMAAENCSIEPGDTVAIWGCGPVGQFAIRSAWMLGAGRVIAIDRVPERLAMAREGKAETINFDDVKVYDRLMELTNGRGPDRCIDAVGAEAQGSGSVDAIVDKANADAAPAGPAPTTATSTVSRSIPPLYPTPAQTDDARPQRQDEHRGAVGAPTAHTCPAKRSCAAGRPEPSPCPASTSAWSIRFRSARR